MRLINSNFSTRRYSILLILSLVVFACGENHLEVDTSTVQLDLKVKRFEQELFSHKNITDVEVAQLKNEYGIFFTHFVENIITISEVNDPSVYYYLNAFKNDSYVNEVQKKVNETYQDFSPYQNQLTESFKLYKYYFPTKHVPEIITYTSGFNYAIAADSAYLGIGLDMFLGADYKPYVQLGLPQYKVANMTKDHVVTSAVMAWVATEFELAESNSTLLTEMVHQGRLLYVLDLLTPYEKEHLKIGYTVEQLDWCNSNEKEIWFYLVDNELFYTKEVKEIIKYMGEAPFVQGFPEGSPGKVGHWVGWQIVKNFMKNNPKLTLQDLMNETDAQKILNLSKYKP
jgi:gliding motility-associated lipoprotein GldB